MPIYELTIKEEHHRRYRIEAESPAAAFVAWTNCDFDDDEAEVPGSREFYQELDNDTVSDLACDQPDLLHQIQTLDPDIKPDTPTAVLDIELVPE